MNDQTKGSYLTGIGGVVALVILGYIAIGQGLNLSGIFVGTFAGVFGILGVCCFIKPDFFGPLLKQLFENVIDSFAEDKKQTQIQKQINPKYSPMGVVQKGNMNVTYNINNQPSQQKNEAKTKPKVEPKEFCKDLEKLKRAIESGKTSLPKTLADEITKKASNKIVEFDPKGISLLQEIIQKFANNDLWDASHQLLIFLLNQEREQPGTIAGIFNRSLIGHLWWMSEKDKYAVLACEVLVYADPESAVRCICQNLKTSNPVFVAGIGGYNLFPIKERIFERMEKADESSPLYQQLSQIYERI
ncbi:MAG: hypothetical protein V1847_02305 [Candidatus Diapherotrites archaeon]